MPAFVLDDCLKLAADAGYQGVELRVHDNYDMSFLALKVIDDSRVSLGLADVIAALNSLHKTPQRHCQGGSYSPTFVGSHRVSESDSYFPLPIVRLLLSVSSV